ncbi:hypothetical protein GW17_00023422 [Ensete ventricosum]|nr:hypothetical protein GW17_00023422 [Ensete ventricosum]
MEMPETSRLRDRGAKKDRDRDRSSRRKRRRGERTLHGSNRDEGDQSSENSLDEDEEDDDDDLFVPKPVTGAKHRPPKISKSTSFGQDEIEIEVAEWISTAPKRKRPRPVRFDEESSMSPVGLHNLSSISLSSIAKIDPEHQIKAEASSPRSEKNNASPAIIQGGGSADVLVSQAGFSDVQESAKTEKKDLHPSSGGSDARDGVENKEELVSPSKDSTCTNVDANLRGENEDRSDGKLSPDAGDLHDFDSDLKSQGPEIETALKINNENKEEKATENALVRDRQQTDKSMEKDFDLKKQVAIKQNLDLQLDLENPKQDIIVTDKVQMSKLHVKDPKVEPKQEKSGNSSIQYSLLLFNLCDI